METLWKIKLTSSSASICIDFIRSQASMDIGGQHLGSDDLFRLSIGQDLVASATRRDRGNPIWSP